MPPSSDTNVTFGWDWRVTGFDRFEVLVTVRYEASAERAEEVEVSVVGVFRLPVDSPSVALRDFVRVHAPGILMPYAREVVSSLTGRGFFGPVFMPPINVHSLMERMNDAVATGAQQLQENPSLFRLAGHSGADWLNRLGAPSKDA
jgi:preprotein translocase subunit SecB